MPRLKYNDKILKEAENEIQWLLGAWNSLQYSIAMVVIAKSALKRLNRKHDKVAKWAIKQIDKIGRYDDDDLHALGNEFTYRSTIIYLSSILETFVRKTIHDLISRNPHIQVSKINDMKITIGEIQNKHKGDVGKIKAEYAINEIIGNKIGIEIWELAFSDVGLKSGLNSNVRKYIRELIKIRNSIAHRNASADERLSNDLGYKLPNRNGKVHLNSRKMSHYISSSIWYIFEIKQRINVIRLGKRSVDLDSAMIALLAAHGVA